MTEVAYELAIIGGKLSADESAALEQAEKLIQIARRFSGDAVGAWEYHFPTFAKPLRRPRARSDRWA